MVVTIFILFFIKNKYGINEGELVGWSFNAILASLDCFLESNTLKKCIQKYFLSSIIS